MLRLFANRKQNRDLRRAIKNILGFCPGNIFLYQLAFRHRSVSKVTNGVRRNNERLEYLGDAVLSVVIANYLFKKYPTQDEGFLTEMRSKIVSRASLNKVGQHMGLHKMIQLDQGHNSGGFKSVDGDALEALIGAIFLDKGFKFTQKIILKRIVGMHMDVDALERKDWNYKSKLIDWCQRERKKADFRVDSSARQGSKRLYKVEVRVDGEIWATALEHSIKSAEQLAAENAYKKVVDPWLEAHAEKHGRLADEMEAEKRRAKELRLQRQKEKEQQAARKKAEEAVAVAAAVAMQAMVTETAETVESVAAVETAESLASVEIAELVVPVASESTEIETVVTTAEVTETLSESAVEVSSETAPVAYAEREESPAETLWAAESAPVYGAPEQATEQEPATPAEQVIESGSASVEPTTPVESNFENPAEIL